MGFKEINETLDPVMSGFIELLGAATLNQVTQPDRASNALNPNAFRKFT